MCEALHTPSPSLFSLVKLWTDIEDDVYRFAPSWIFASSWQITGNTTNIVETLIMSSLHPTLLPD